MLKNTTQEGKHPVSELPRAGSLMCKPVSCLSTWPPASGLAPVGTVGKEQRAPQSPSAEPQSGAEVGRHRGQTGPHSPLQMDRVLTEAIVPREPLMTAEPGNESSPIPSPSGDLSTVPSRALPRRRGSHRAGCCPQSSPSFCLPLAPTSGVCGAPHSGHITSWLWTLMSAQDWVLWHPAN